MALIKLGALAQDVRGSLNGTTFSKNRAGAYARAKVSPVQPASDFSSAARAIFKSLAQTWPPLTPATQQAWNTYATAHPYTNVFGDSITLSGIAMFQAINRAVLQCGGTPVTDPATIVAPPDLGGITPTITTLLGVPSIMIAATTPPTAPFGEYVFATPPLIPSRKLQKTEFRLINTQTTGAFPDPLDLGPAYLERFGITKIPVSSHIALTVRALDPSRGGQGHPYQATVLSSGT